MNLLGRRTGRAAAMAYAMACAAVLAVTGCTGGGPDGTGATSGQPATLADYLGFSALERGAGGGVVGLPQLSDAEEQRQHALQELIARCMADAGFEYVPVSPTDQLAALFGDAHELGPQEFAERYGYGVSTLDADGSALDELDDPNDRIRDGLPPADQEEYQLALWGGNDAGEQPGCHARASAEVYGNAGQVDQGFAQFADLFDALDALYREIEEDSRLADAHADWAACMADAGHPDLAVPADAQQSVFERMSALYESADSTASGEPDPAALADLREYELALAPADHACQQEHVAGPRTEVITEREEEFVTGHRAELERYRDWLTGVRSAD